MAGRNSNTKRALTEAFIKNIKANGTRQEYRDTKTSGLTFRVNPDNRSKVPDQHGPCPLKQTVICFYSRQYFG
jgi:hypothetical protein